MMSQAVRVVRPVAVRRSAAFAAWNIALVLALLAPSAEGAENEDKGAEAKLLQAAYGHDAETYEFFADAKHERKLAREPKPVLHWASPDDWSGDIFVWTHGGRPEVVGCMLSGPRTGGGRIFFHEFHALGTQPLPSQNLPDGKTWAPASAGLTFTPIEGAPAPAGSEKERMTQMRMLAREFSAHLRFGESDWELRLLPQPMSRYQRPAEGASPDWLDGGLFTYVLTTGTDAEVLLVLEARKQGDAYRWHYAPARITNRAAWMRRGDKEIWRVDVHTEEGGEITRPYTTFFAGDRTTDDLKSAAEPVPDPLKTPPDSGDKKPAPVPQP